MELPIDYDEANWQTRKAARLQYIKNQKEMCHHCGAPLSGRPIKSIQDYDIDESIFPPNMLKNPIHLHHCRKTGMTIGAVHARCNCFLFQELGE